MNVGKDKRKSKNMQNFKNWKKIKIFYTLL